MAWSCLWRRKVAGRARPVKQRWASGGGETGGSGVELSSAEKVSPSISKGPAPADRFSCGAQPVSCLRSLPHRWTLRISRGGGNKAGKPGRRRTPGTQRCVRIFSEVRTFEIEKKLKFAPLLSLRQRLCLPMQSLCLPLRLRTSIPCPRTPANLATRTSPVCRCHPANHPNSSENWTPLTHRMLPPINKVFTGSPSKQLQPRRT